MKKVLITGGTGFAGTGLAKMLLNDPSKNYAVTVLDFIAPLQAESLLDFYDCPRLKYIWKALQDCNSEDFLGQDVVVHLAAQADVPMGFQSPRWTVEQNVMGTIALLEAVKGLSIEKVIVAGSGNEIGRPLYLPIDENHPLTPHNPYSFSKAAEEMAAWAYHRCYGVPVVLMSNGIVTGPGMRREIFVFKWLYNILRGYPVVLEGGDQTRDLTYVTDVLDAWRRVIDAEPTGEIIGQKFQVSYGEEHSVEEIMQWCFEVCGVDSRGQVIRAPHRPGEQGQREWFDNTKARQVLGYSPAITPIRSLELTRDWIEDTWFRNWAHLAEE